MNTRPNRRTFLKQSATLGAGLALGAPLRSLAAESNPSRKLTVGVMGLGRGADHIAALLQLQNVEIGWLSDVDQQRLAKAAKLVETKQSIRPKVAADFRRILEDKAVDALFIAAPNHWHAPATILACSAGKHVYVEKPGSHNAQEGEWMVAAARKNKRVVQLGTQRRSYPAIIEAMEKLRAGAIGKVRFGRSSYTNARASIGRGRPAPVPPYLDYGLWQGPAPERPYVDNLVHYNWHWRWHWGGGELANNGVHVLDLVRWGLAVDFPKRISFTGGRYHFDDDQETPDTGVAVFDFGSKGAAWDNSSCNPRAQDKLPLAAFYGDAGSLVITDNGYRILDPKGEEVGHGTGPGGTEIHIENFLNAIRSGDRPTAEIEEGQKSTLLCHLGNIAWRVGRTIDFDPDTRRVLHDPDAAKLWGREYRPGFQPRV